MTLADDGEARSTAGNARAVAAAAARTGATEVVLVTSSWHGPRARALLRAALDDPHVLLTLVPARHPRPPFLLARELACALALPAQLVRLRRSRGSRRGR
ncbi:MAG: ElyC/SanA/YdcF family protein [Gaiellaceae bacterium]